jgi:hypothetical protein
MDLNQKDYSLKWWSVRGIFLDKIEKIIDRIEIETEIEMIEKNMFKNNRVSKISIHFKVNLFLFRTEKELQKIK